MSDETCQRCGEKGEDRRTLWHACFYAMNELPVPFEETTLYTANPDLVTEYEVEVPYSITKYTAEGPEPTKRGTYADKRYKAEDSKVDAKRFFTLRVCKDCRGDWMEAITSWFQTPVTQEESCGSGIFVRREGRNVEVTEEEWNQLQKEKSSHAR